MSDLLVFGIGVVVTAMVSGSVALLMWAALTGEDSARPAADKRAVGKAAGVGHRNDPSRHAAS